MVKLPEKWPYSPPKNFDLKPLSEHWRPAGHLLLSETVDLFGRAIFGEEWTGEELRARHVERSFPERRNCEGRVITTIEPIIEAALTLWEQEHPKLVEMWRTEQSARKRHDEIVRRLRTDLNARTLQAWAHRTEVGDLVQIPPYIWGRDGIESVFALENNPISWRNPNIIEFREPLGKHGFTGSVEGRVILRQSDIERYLSPAQETAPTPQENDERPELKPDENQPPDNEQISYPGRPSQMRAIEKEMRRRTTKQELKATLAAESGALHNWADEKFPDQQIPTARTIQNALRKAFRELRDKTPIK